MKRITIIITFIHTLLTGCATTVQFSPILKLKEKEAITKVKVISIIEQSEIGIQSCPSNIGIATGVLLGGVAGGLIGATIDSSIRMSREKKVAPKLSRYKAMLQDYDINKKLSESIKANLIKSNLPITEIITRHHSESEFQVDDYINNLENEKLLVIKTSYSFHPSVNMIHVVSNARLYLDNNKNYLTSLDFNGVDEGVNTTEPEKYLFKKWSTTYQTPQSISKFLIRNNKTKNAELQKIAKLYNEKIAASTKRYKRSELLLKKRNALVALERRRYIKLSPPIDKGEMSKSEIIQQIDQAIHAVSESIVLRPQLHLSSEQVEKGKTVIYSVPASNAGKMSPSKGLNVIELDRKNNNTSSYLSFPGSNLYILSGNESLYLPCGIKK